MVKPGLKATLTLVVEYDEVPDTEDLEEIIDSARGLGRIKQADLGVHQPYKRSLL